MIRPLRFGVAWLFVIWALPGCWDALEPWPHGDGGSSKDAGSGPDAGVVVDGGVTEDAAVEVDGGPGPDAGWSADGGGTGEDGGPGPDAGWSADGGGTGEDGGPGPDAGTASDGGNPISDGGVFTADGGTSPVEDAGVLGDAGADGGTSGEPSCAMDAHVENGACVPNERNCSVQNGTGRQIWAADAWGPCQIEACSSEYHEENDACISNTRSCTVPNGIGAETWDNGSWGSCVRTSCSSGYHEENDACISSTRSCTVPNGIGAETWDNGSWGSCVRTSCNSGYHVEGTICTSDTRQCTIANGVGRETWAGTTWGACQLVICNSGYHAAVGTCEANTRACEVTNGTGTQNYENGSWGICIRTMCNSGYHDGGDGSCVTTDTCASGFELSSDGACVYSVGGYIGGPLSMQFAVIPAGTFTMGSPPGELGRQTNETEYDVSFTYNFAMGVTEVTQSQWKALASGANPSHFQSCGDNCPVERVGWFATLAYANALSALDGLDSCYSFSPALCADEVSDWSLGETSCTSATFAGLGCTGYRLPTEAEWEYAYRAGTLTAYHNGANSQIERAPLDDNLDAIAWYGGNSAVTYSGGYDCSAWFGDVPTACGTHPVGDKQANDWGLYDMSGNVWEWTWDWFGLYPGARTDFTGPNTGFVRVFRGGSWGDKARAARAAYRTNVSPESGRDMYGGFRLVRTLP